MQSPGFILLTVDVEDWFQVENLRPVFPIECWNAAELRVERNVHRLLDLFDASNSNTFQAAVSNEDNGSREACGLSTKPKIKATFFVLGWIAERLPHLVREIGQRGHEVASHGYTHRLCCDCSPLDLHKDIGDSKKLLEDITGAQVFGYRAPSFSVSEEALELIASNGYKYDSSYNSFKFNQRYGRLDCPPFSLTGIASRHKSGLFELPIGNLPFGPAILPAGGGAYFRLIPLSVFHCMVRRILNRQGAYVFYLHPWEIDPGQPRVGGIEWFPRLRHYTNLKRTAHKLAVLLESFSHYRFINCKDYVDLLQVQHD